MLAAILSHQPPHAPTPSFAPWEGCFCFVHKLQCYTLRARETIFECERMYSGHFKSIAEEIAIVENYIRKNGIKKYLKTRGFVPAVGHCPPTHLWATSLHPFMLCSRTVPWAIEIKFSDYMNIKKANRNVLLVSCSF